MMTANHIGYKVNKKVDFIRILVLVKNLKIFIGQLILLTEQTIRNPVHTSHMMQ